MVVAVVPGDPGLFDLVGIVFLLVIVPLVVFAVIAIAVGYLQHDAEAYLEELAEVDELEGAEAGDDEGSESTATGRPIDDGDGDADR